MIVGTIILAVAAVYVTYLLTQAVSDALPTLRGVSKKIDNEEKRVNDYINKHDLGMTIAASVLASRTVKDDYNVYILFDKSTENPLYVGITNSPARRLPEHGRDLRFSSYILEMKVVSKGQDYYTARIIEQLLIEGYRVSTIVGVFNRRNSISPLRFRNNLQLYEYYTLIGR